MNFSKSPISDQSLNGTYSGSRGPREEVKKGKSSKFNPSNNEQVKSSPALKVWSHEGSNRYPKMAKKWLNRAKTEGLHGTPKNFLRSNEGVSATQKSQIAKIN